MIVVRKYVRTVDDNDVTAELKDTLAKAQAGARYYTFTIVTENHTIHAAFEKDGNTPGGGDKPNGRGDSKARQEPVCTLEIWNTASGWMMGAV